MHLPRLIGISAKMGCGKTTFADMFIDRFPDYTKLNFGGILKHDISKFYNVPIDWMYDREKKSSIVNPVSTWQDTKNRYAKFVGRPRKGASAHDPSVPPLPRDNMNVREVMQWYGTDFRRATDDNYWISRMRDLLKENPWAVIDDVRFENEAEMIRDLGGFLIRIDPFPTYKLYSGNTHVSETVLDDYDHFDFRIAPHYGHIKQSVMEVVSRIEQMNQ